MNRIFQSAFCVLALLIAGQPSIAQPIPFDSNRWTIEAAQHSIQEYEGRQSLFLLGGFAYLNDVEATDGTMEFDIAFGPERGFVGAVWRMLDYENHEEFYIRPHQSGNPDANQYSPVFNRLSAWQLYHGEGYGAPVDYDFDEWIPVKIVFSGAEAEIYIEDMAQPLLVVPELKREVVSGKVGLRVKNFAPAYFANFRFTPHANPAQSPKLHGRETKTSAGTITSWQVSSAFSEGSLQGKVVLAEAAHGDFTWDRLECESSGLANFSRLRHLDQGTDCVFARAVVNADQAQVKKLEFGYSDRARVYLNGRLIYEGNNSYRSRDYRYLGSIGFFDALHLQFDAGRNELWIAVGESFGGWGLRARFTEPDGLRVGD